MLHRHVTLGSHDRQMETRTWFPGLTSGAGFPAVPEHPWRVPLALPFLPPLSTLTGVTVPTQYNVQHQITDWLSTTDVIYMLEGYSHTLLPPSTQHTYWCYYTYTIQHTLSNNRLTVNNTCYLHDVASGLVSDFSQRSGAWIIRTKVHENFVRITQNVRIIHTPKSMGKYTIVWITIVWIKQNVQIITVTL